jgi:hypothetical protein
MFENFAICGKTLDGLHKTANFGDFFVCDCEPSETLTLKHFHTGGGINPATAHRPLTPLGEHAN